MIITIEEMLFSRSVGGGGSAESSGGEYTVTRTSTTR